MEDFYSDSERSEECIGLTVMRFYRHYYILLKSVNTFLYIRRVPILTYTIASLFGSKLVVHNFTYFSVFLIVSLSARKNISGSNI